MSTTSPSRAPAHATEPVVIHGVATHAVWRLRERFPQVAWLLPDDRRAERWIAERAADAPVHYRQERGDHLRIASVPTTTGCAHIIFAMKPSDGGYNVATVLTAEMAQNNIQKHEQWLRHTRGQSTSLGCRN